MQWGKHSTDHRLGEKRRLPFAFDPFFNFYGNRRNRLLHFDQDRLMRFNALFLDLDNGFTLASHLTPDTSILHAIDQITQTDISHLQQAAKALDRREPRHSRKHAPTNRQCGKHHQCRAGIAEKTHRQLPDSRPHDSTGRQWQLSLERVKTQSFQPATGDQQEQKPGQCDVQGTSICRPQTVQTTIAPPHDSDQQDNPPPCRKAKDIKQQIGKPCTTSTCRVMQRRTIHGMRPARVTPVIAPQRQTKKCRQCNQRQPA